MSGYESGEGFVVAGMEAIDAVDPTDYKDAVVEHLRKLRTTRVTYDSTLVMIIEYACFRGTLLRPAAQTLTHQ